MQNSFNHASSYLVTSESVTEGHPDKLCDQISDAILDAMLEKDPSAHVACEVASAMGMVFVLGEISCECYVEIPEIDAGYTKPDYGFDYRTCGVLVSVNQQSSDIALGVNKSLEIKTGKSSDAILDKTGAGDQGIMVGFACIETAELIPLPSLLAHKLCKQLAKVRKDNIIPYLRPDGKSQVTIEYCHGSPKRVKCLVLGAQHDPDVTLQTIERDLKTHVIDKVIPVGDTGFTGRKIIVDNYGSICRHGGGCFSGKDPTKVDRSAAYMARYTAKNLVAAGLADYLELQVSYVIGKARPLSLSIETYGTGRIPDEEILALIYKHFDFRPEAIIKTLGLRRPIYRQTAVYGHFGREDLGLPWEKTDKAAILKAEAGAVTG